MAGAICSCRHGRYAYNTRVTRSGRRLNGRSPMGTGSRPTAGVSALSGLWAFLCDRLCNCRYGAPGPKRGFAPGRLEPTKGFSVPLYEHVFLARQDISQAQVDALVKEYGEVITEGGG